MSSAEEEAERKREAEATADPPRVYERPRIAWRERYEPASFGLSCSKQPGNPGCVPGPTSA